MRHHLAPRRVGRVPGRHPRREPGQPPVGRHDAHLLLAREAALAQPVPALVVGAPIAFEVARARLQRHVRRVVRDIEEERLVGIGRAVRAQPAGRTIGPVVAAEVVVRIGVAGDEAVAVDQVARREAVGLGADEAVETVEAALQRPGGAVTGRLHVVVGGVVPLADAVGRPAALAQQLGQGRCVGADLARLVAREAGVVVRQPAAADRMRILAGQQRGTRRRAHRHGRVAGEAQAARGECIDVRGPDLAAVAAEVGEAQVVEQDHHDVGRALGGRGARTPPWRGRRERPADLSLPALAGVPGQPLRLAAAAFGAHAARAARPAAETLRRTSRAKEYAAGPPRARGL